MREENLKETVDTCTHPTARRGPGSAAAWVSCTLCGEQLGMAIPVNEALSRAEDAILTARKALKWREHELRGTRLVEE